MTKYILLLDGTDEAITFTSRSDAKMYIESEIEEQRMDCDDIQLYRIGERLRVVAAMEIDVKVGVV